MIKKKSYQNRNQVEETIDSGMEEKTKQINSFWNRVNVAFPTKELIIRQLPFVFYIAFLAVIYIANKYHAEKIVRESNELQKEVKELRAKKIAIESELMYISKQSIVASMVKSNGLDLKESLGPPIKIIVREE